ncbi:uncharacterized protein VTP21DRAFT_3143 [Calcarisporiella thermophila]|uniref:uncharacterized protein n=1 Tax=Calcarisporiella thermophila TaxID=911321 RepID=UPI0037429355
MTFDFAVGAVVKGVVMMEGGAKGLSFKREKDDLRSVIGDGGEATSIRLEYGRETDVLRGREAKGNLDGGILGGY